MSYDSQKPFEMLIFFEILQAHCGYIILFKYIDLISLNLNNKILNLKSYSKYFLSKLLRLIKLMKICFI